MIEPILMAGGIDIGTPSKVPGLVASDLILIVGLAALLFGAIITWIVFVRGPKTPKESRAKPITPAVTTTEDGRERVRKKKRTRRREHRQTNPTLAQTGGLPPPRPPEESPTI